MLKLLLGSNYGRNDTAEGAWGGGARCVPSQVSQTARCRESVFPLLRNSYALARLLNISKKKKKNVEKARVDILWTRSSREGLMRFTRRVVFYGDPSPILKQRGS